VFLYHEAVEPVPTQLHGEDVVRVRGGQRHILAPPARLRKYELQ
jgi:hypothetical protein